MEDNIQSYQIDNDCYKKTIDMLNVFIDGIKNDRDNIQEISTSFLQQTVDKLNSIFDDYENKSIYQDLKEFLINYIRQNREYMIENYYLFLFHVKILF